MTAIDRIVYELAYRVTKPRWDDGQVPPQVAQLTAAAGRSARAIDVGCGTGTHSIYLAEQGLAVTGIDASQTAIRRAKEKALQAGVTPEFILHDVTRLEFLADPFDVALDMGCLHGLGDTEQQRYAAELGRLMRAGGTLLVWAMDSRGLTPVRVKELFVPAFSLERVEEVQLHRRPSRWYWLRRQ